MDKKEFQKIQRRNIFLSIGIPALATGVALAISVVLHFFVFEPWYTKTTSSTTGPSVAYLIIGGFAFAAILFCAATFLIAEQRGLSNKWMWSCMIISIITAPLCVNWLKVLSKDTLQIEINISYYWSCYLVPCAIFVLTTLVYFLLTISRKNQFGWKTKTSVHISAGAITLGLIVYFFVWWAQNGWKAAAGLMSRLSTIVGSVAAYFTLLHTMDEVFINPDRAYDKKFERESLIFYILWETGLPFAGISVFVGSALLLIGLIIMFFIDGVSFAKTAAREAHNKRFPIVDKKPARSGTAKQLLDQLLTKKAINTKELDITNEQKNKVV